MNSIELVTIVAAMTGAALSAGRWIVRLVMSDETALEAAIQVGSGFILCFR